MVDSLINLDFELFKLLNQPWPGGDTIMWAVSGIWWWTPVYFFLLWKVWQVSGKEWDKTIFRVLFLVVCIAATDMISARIIKPGVQRFRPSHSIELRDNVHLVTPSGQTQPYRGGRFGFVSSHMANYTGIALYLGLLFGGGRWLLGLCIWSVIIGYSRIYLGVHFPLDIAGGAILGAFVGYVLWRIQHKFLGQAKQAAA